MGGFIKFLKVCELINMLIFKAMMLTLKMALLMPVWVIGFVLYQVMFK